MSDDKEIKPAKAEKPAKEPKPVITKIEANGIIRPNEGTATGNVWAIADRISGEKKAPAERGEVVKQCVSEGINESTAATQYGRWRKFFGVVTVKKIKLSDEEKAAERAANKAAKAAEKEAAAKVKADEKAAKAATEAATKAAEKAAAEKAKAEVVAASVVAGEPQTA
jgi:hypothetical protein